MVAPTIAVRPLESAVWAALHDVHDPEIPTVSIVDLGVVGRVDAEPCRVRVELLPTFVGCPAIDVMREITGTPQIFLMFLSICLYKSVFTWFHQKINLIQQRRIRASDVTPMAQALTTRGSYISAVSICAIMHHGESGTRLTALRTFLPL